jgi:hypothetical protein
MKLARLPGWVIPNDLSVEREVAEFRDMPLEQKARLRAGLARALGRMLAARDDPTLYDHVDPLPPSTVAALARLRRAR